MLDKSHIPSPLNPHKRKGFNLVEAAIVLGVVGLVIGGIWVAASTVSENMKVNQLKTGSQQIIENFRQAWNGFAMADMMGATGAPYMGIYPSAFQNIAGFTFVDQYRIYDPWGQNIGAVYDAAGYYGDTFSLAFYDVSKSVCLKMMYYWGGQAERLGIVRIISNGDTVDFFPYTPTATDCALPLNSVGAQWTK